MIKILVATPAYGGQLYVGYLTNIIKLDRLCRENNIIIDYEFCFNESLITRARNTLTHKFMATDYTHLLFIDADIEFEPLDIIKLIQSEKDVIGGLYPKKCIDWNNVKRNIEAGCNINDIPLSGRLPVSIILNENDLNVKEEIIETRYTGTGIFLIKRDVLDKMKEKFPNDYYNADGISYFKFFDTELKYGVYLSEDYWFCDRWREMGGKVYLLKSFRCKHWGVYAY